MECPHVIRKCALTGFENTLRWFQSFFEAEIDLVSEVKVAWWSALHEANPVEFSSQLIQELPLWLIEWLRIDLEANSSLTYATYTIQQQPLSSTWFLHVTPNSLLISTNFAWTKWHCDVTTISIFDEICSWDLQLFGERLSGQTCQCQCQDPLSSSLSH